MFYLTAHGFLHFSNFSFLIVLLLKYYLLSFSYVCVHKRTHVPYVYTCVTCGYLWHLLSTTLALLSDKRKRIFMSCHVDLFMLCVPSDMHNSSHAHVNAHRACCMKYSHLVSTQNYAPNNLWFLKKNKRKRKKRKEEEVQQPNYNKWKDLCIDPTKLYNFFVLSKRIEHDLNNWSEQNWVIDWFAASF